MILVLMVLLLILDDPSPFYWDQLMVIFLLIAPLNTEDVALLAETKDDIIDSYCKKVGIFEDPEARHCHGWIYCG